MKEIIERLQECILAYDNAAIAGSGDAAQAEEALRNEIAAARHVYARLGRTIAIAEDALRPAPTCTRDVGFEHGSPALRNHGCGTAALPA